MPVTINGDGSITGLSVGGLGSGVVNTATLANGAATGAKLALPSGSVIQVKQTVKTDTDSATAENTWEDIAGMSVSITPSNSSNKIRVTAICNVNSTHGTYWVLRVVKDGSIFGAEGDAAGSRSRGFGGHYDTENNYSIHCAVVDFLDTAGGTSSITYKVQWYNPYGSSTRYINRSATSEDGDYRARTASTITAMEIKA